MAEYNLENLDTFEQATDFMEEIHINPFISYIRSNF